MAKLNSEMAQKIINMARGIWSGIPDDVEVRVVRDTTVILDDGTQITLNAAFGNPTDGAYRAAYIPEENTLYVLMGKTRWESRGGYQKLVEG